MERECQYQYFLRTNLMDTFLVTRLPPSPTFHPKKKQNFISFPDGAINQKLWQGFHPHFDQPCQQFKQKVHKKDFTAKFHKNSCHE